MIAPRRFAAAAVALLIGATQACNCGDPPPIDETFDGNIIIGDALPPGDADPEDVGFDPDAAPDSGDDASERDAAEDGGDASESDADAAEDAAIDSGVDCAVTATITLSSSDAVAMAATLAGQIIDVTGTATITERNCTDTACEDGGSCCNTCTAVVSIDARLPLVASECFASPGCAGTECAQVCRPAVLGVPQRFRGRMQNPAVLELFSVLP